MVNYKDSTCKRRQLTNQIKTRAKRKTKQKQYFEILLRNFRSKFRELEINLLYIFLMITSSPKLQVKMLTKTTLMMMINSIKLNVIIIITTIIMFKACNIQLGKS